MTRLLSLCAALLLAGLLLTPDASADCRRAVVVRRKAVVVEQVVPVVTVFREIALYSAIYAPAPVLPVAPSTAPAATPPASPAPGQDAVLEYLKRLDARLERLERGRGAPVMPPADGGGGIDVKIPPAQGGGLAALVQAKCAACHGDTAARDGKGLVLLAGGAVPALPPQVKLKIIQRVHRQEMPPPDNVKGIKPLSDEEYALLVEELSR